MCILEKDIGRMDCKLGKRVLFCYITAHTLIIHPQFHFSIDASCPDVSDNTRCSLLQSLLVSDSFRPDFLCVVLPECCWDLPDFARFAKVVLPMILVLVELQRDCFTLFRALARGLANLGLARSVGMQGKKSMANAR